VKVFSQEELDNLISCPKVITDAPRRQMRLERRHKRNDMRLRSADGDLEFTVFMRINEDFQENFSIGLIHVPREERGSLCLFRCNGPHGDFLGGSGPPGSHFQYHVHRAKVGNLEAGLRAEHGATLSREYASYRDALTFFLREINVINAFDFFPELSQPMLPLDLPGKETES